MTTVNLEQGSQEWLELRRTKVGASEISYLFEANPFAKMEDQWLELIGIKKGFIDIFVSRAMREGNENEGRVIEYMEDLIGIETEPLIGYEGDVLASFDGIDLDQENIIEVKYSNKTYNEVREGKVAWNYMLQCQQQLYVSGAKVCYFAAMNPEDDDLAYIKIERDEELMKSIVDNIEDFMSYMNDREWSEDNFSTDREDDAWESTVNAYMAAMAVFNEAKEKLDEAKQALTLEAGGHKTSGFGLTVYPVKGRETMNWKQLAIDNGLKADDKYKKNGKGSWSVRINK